MKKVTAVQFLIQNIVEDQTIKAKSMSEWIMVFEKVKAIEKEQIIKAVYHNCNEMSHSDLDCGEEYYNETFNK